MAEGHPRRGRRLMVVLELAVIALVLLAALAYVIELRK
jgi:hypothetical protein